MAPVLIACLFVLWLCGLCLAGACYMDRNMNKWGTACLFALVVFTVIILVGYCGLASLDYGTGHRDGYVQKFSTAGVLFKTREGQLGLNQQGFNEWHFSVADGSVANDLEKLDTRQLVRLHYRQQLGALPWKGETDYFVVRVEVLDDKPAK